jgi:putative MATE family efflux protein
MELTVKKQFAKYVSLNVLGMISISCYILADTYFISSGIGSLGIVALNLCLPFYNLIFGTGMMLGTGGGIRYSILVANGEVDKANKLFTNVVVFGLFISLIFLVLGLTLSVEITSLLGATGQVLEYASVYFRIFMTFSPLFITNEIFLTFVKNSGAPRLAMTSMIVGSLSNVVLDYIFIVILKMGMAGAAYATICSPAVSICIVLPYLFSKKNKLNLKKIKLHFEILVDSCHLGLNAFINDFGFGFVMMIFNYRILALQGDIGVAAYGVVANIAIVVNAIFNGIAFGMQPILSKAYGQGNYKKVKSILKMGIIVTLCTFVFFYATLTIFSTPIITIFNSENNAELLTLAKQAFYIYLFGYLFASLNLVIGQYFASIENPQYSFYLSLLHAGIVIIPLMFLLSHFMGMEGIWFSFVIAEFAIFCISLLFLSKKKNNVLE